MLDVAARLALDDVAFLLPVAAGSSWYAGRYFDPPGELEPELGCGRWTRSSTRWPVAQSERPGPGQVVLGGFSQGACLVAELVARGQVGDGLRGLAILTGALMGPADERGAAGGADRPAGVRLVRGAGRVDRAARRAGDRAGVRGRRRQGRLRRARRHGAPRL